MPIVTMQHNFFNVGPNDRAFIVSSNFCDMFMLGEQSSDDFYLRGEMAGPEKEFIFNGRIFVPGLSEAGTIIDNFPRVRAPKGWVKRLQPHGRGYQLVDDTSGVVLFGYRELDGRCLVEARLFSKDGRLVAETAGSDFVIHLGPAQIGTGGLYVA